ncbi:subclass B3 metallo-beta-lactamase [Erythrobacter insulae]|nr:subclass B3 metallo-beta-lactamase [Erythrobacter insulae]
MITPDERLDHPWMMQCGEWDGWNKPGPSFQIFDNTYYVGTCGISSILITGDDGHILIDTGTEKGADLVKANIEQLGFKLGDIKVILHSHEHHDHVGGMAKMKEWTGAKVLASTSARKVLETGNVGPDDPQFGVHPDLAPVTVDEEVWSGKDIVVGNLKVEAIATPGHTPGAMSWTWASCHASVCADIMYADSLSPVSADGYKFGDHPEYLNQYKLALERLAARDCNLLITPHPSASNMFYRMKRVRGLLGEEMCTGYARAIERRLDARLKHETEEASE